MHRHVSCSVTVHADGPRRLAFMVGVADPAAVGADEELRLHHDGEVVEHLELVGPHGSRTWLIDVPAGETGLEYRASLAGTLPPAPGVVEDELVYLRPSRYCESDRLVGFASRHFRGVTGAEDILAAVTSWVGTQLEYVSGSSDATDGAVDTLLAARGVCRDFAHLAVALLRAMEIPARVVSVYAPGLDPMDFHAVAEAWVDGGWHVVDGTLLAPRPSLVRIATGRDAADISWLTSHGGDITLRRLEVSATVAPALPTDDVHRLVQLA